MNKETEPMTAEEFLAAVTKQTKPTEAEKLEYLRDHFAGLAMQALIQRDEPNIAWEAYRLADKMLKEREK